MHSRIHSCVLLPLLCLLFAAPWTHAEDHFLTIGGGGAPTNNQISLEKNILYLQRFLADAGLSKAPNDIFFACGQMADRDVQYYDPAAPRPRVNELLARIFDRERYSDVQYRAHAIPNIKGPANRASINAWFDTVGAKLKDDDRLFIYFTGHGGRGNPVRNTTMQLWNENPMPVKDFSGLLDKIPAKVPVVLVMVQCFSGGFADVIFKPGLEDKELSPRNRCGFYATVQEREAAGCTPDIAEENYHEYSTYFWSALYGKTRLGQTVPAPDFDGDGRISFMEAHAFTQINSETVDIPVCTSDAFLRAFSKTKLLADARGAQLVTSDTPYSQILKAATPAQRAVLQGLSSRLKLTSEARGKECRDLLAKVEKEKTKYDVERNRGFNEYAQLRNQLQFAVRTRWPEFHNAWHPRVSVIMRDESKAVVELIEKHPAFKRFDELAGKVEESADKAFEQEKQAIKCQRLLRTLETVALAANLPRFADKKTQDRYAQLVAAEGGTLEKARP